MGNIKMEEIIKTENLGFSYYENDKTGVFENINLSIKRGSFTAIIGPNGSGKSTLAKLLCGVYVPTSGSVLISDINGNIYKSGSDEDMYNIRKTIGMVFQNPDNQLVATLVEEDVAFAPENMGVEPSEIRRRVDESLEAVGLSGYGMHDTHRLSGGQKQRVAIAGILAMMPECIIFDEATAMLDPKGRKDVMDTIVRLRSEKNITVIIITHHMSEAAMADRIVVIDSGKVISDGSPREVFGQKEMLERAGLEVPQSSELVRRMYDSGYDVAKTVLSISEAANTICENINSQDKTNND